MKRLLVIGGGLTGLSAAWHARLAGAHVRLLESSDQTGGVVQTYQENGYLTETGPNSLQLSSAAQLELFSALGLGDEIVSAAPWARNRFVVRRGVPRPLPLSPLQLIHSPLVNLRVALRLLREPRIPRRPSDVTDEESVANFVRRRFGPEILNYAFDPFVAGVYAGNPAKLSVRHALPRLFALEAEHGSILRGLRAQMRANRRNPSSIPSRSITFRDGLAALPRAFTAQLGNSITTNAHLTSLQRDPTGTWLAAWQTPVHAEQETFDAVIVAVPAYALGRLPLPRALAETLAPLADLEHTPIAVVALGFPQSAVRGRLDGFGLLVPSVEPFDILGTLFTSSIFPGRAPEAHVLLTTFVGGARRPELVAQPDSVLFDLVAADLKALLRIRGAPTYRRLFRWNRAIPQYNLDFGRVLAALDSAERTWPGLALAGSYRGGVSVSQCLEHGRLAADRLLNLASAPSA